jgi:hypothetical protein
MGLRHDRLRSWDAHFYGMAFYVAVTVAILVAATRLKVADMRSGFASLKKPIDPVGQSGSSGGSEADRQAGGKTGSCAASRKLQNANGRTASTPDTGPDTGDRCRLCLFLVIFRHCRFSSRPSPNNIPPLDLTHWALIVQVGQAPWRVILATSGAPGEAWLIQRAFRLPEGTTYYRHFRRLGLQPLAI